MTSWEDTNWEGTAPDNDTTDDDEVWPLPNCHQVGGDLMNVHCGYMDEPYTQWMKDHGYSASPSRLPSSTPLSSSTALVPPPTYSPAPTCIASSDCSGHCGSGEAVCWDSFCKCGPNTPPFPTSGLQPEASAASSSLPSIFEPEDTPVVYKA
jgi:hypothetical protein